MNIDAKDARAYTRATQFFLWLWEDVNGISAVAGSPRDIQLKEFADGGFIRLHDCHFGNNYYVLESGCALLDALKSPQGMP